VDIFGKASIVNSHQDISSLMENPTLVRKNTYEGGPPAISQTRIIKDISSELKNNFKEEITKLRDEMNSA